jgi:hypothetical protein
MLEIRSGTGERSERKELGPAGKPAGPTSPNPTNIQAVYFRWFSQLK